MRNSFKAVAVILGMFLVAFFLREMIAAEGDGCLTVAIRGNSATTTQVLCFD